MPSLPAAERLMPLVAACGLQAGTAKVDYAADLLTPAAVFCAMVAVPGVRLKR